MISLIEELSYIDASRFFRIVSDKSCWLCLANCLGLTDVFCSSLINDTTNAGLGDIAFPICQEYLSYLVFLLYVQHGCLRLFPSCLEAFNESCCIFLVILALRDSPIYIIGVFNESVGSQISQPQATP